MANVPDEDGFITVVSKRAPVLEDAEDESEKKKSRKEKILPNFYQFQVNSQKKNGIHNSLY